MVLYIDSSLTILKRNIMKIIEKIIIFCILIFLVVKGILGFSKDILNRGYNWLSSYIRREFESTWMKVWAVFFFTLYFIIVCLNNILFTKVEYPFYHFMRMIIPLVDIYSEINLIVYITIFVGGGFLWLFSIFFILLFSGMFSAIIVKKICK